MFIQLIKISLKSLTRSLVVNGNIFIKILFFISIAYFSFSIFMLGLNFDKILYAYDSQLNSVQIVNSYLFYIIIICVLFLYLLQRKFIYSIYSFSHLPIKRSKLISCILFFVPFNLVNLCFLLFIIPISITIIIPIYGISSFMIYFIAILLLLVFISYFVFLFKNLSIYKSYFNLIYVIIGLFIFSLIISFHRTLTLFSLNIFTDLLNQKTSFLLMITFPLTIVVIINYFLLKKFIYLQNDDKSILERSKLIRVITSNGFSYFWLELNLVLRNKRLRSFFMIATAFVFIFYYSLTKKSQDLYYSFVTFIILSGIYGYIFVQYLYSWESSFFDFISTTKFSLINYLKSKYLIYVILSLLLYIFFLPLIIKDKIDLHLISTALLYNFSIGFPFFFYIASYNRCRIDLNARFLFNMQGYNIAQLIAIFLIIMFPLMVLRWLMNIFTQTVSLVIINIVCILSLTNLNRWFHMIEKQFMNRKYINLEGYRK